MGVIEDFVEQYSKQYDFFQNLSKTAADILERELNRSGIKAITTYRAKNIDRLVEKVTKRNNEKNYKNPQEIFNDICDLAGVRVALYFPSDRETVETIIKKSFRIKLITRFPENSHTPKYDKRFSGYWANHYHVYLIQSNAIESRMLKNIIEIQVASVLMHAWAEVEHDLIYKPLSGDISEEEFRILDEINGLVLSGEIALELLQKAIVKRAKDSNEIGDKYHITNLISTEIGRKYINKLSLGDVNLLNKYMNAFTIIDPKLFISYLGYVNQNVNEPISEQLFNLFLRDFGDSKYLKEFIHSIGGRANNTSQFEVFIREWINYEKIVNTLKEKNHNYSKKYSVLDEKFIIQNQLLSQSDIDKLKELRLVRNQLLHGHKTFSDAELLEKVDELSRMTKILKKSIENS